MKALERILWLVIVITLSGIKGLAQEFTFTTTAANTVASRSTIDLPGLAGNPFAIIIAEPAGDTEKLNPHPVGAWYYNGKWSIFNTDHASMAAGLRFKIRYFLKSGPNQFLHVVTKENLGAEGSYIDSLILNNNPKAQVRIFQNHAPDDRAFYLNPVEANAGYDAAAGKWYIANVGGKRMYPNTAYNILVESGVPDDSVKPASPHPPSRAPFSPPTVPQQMPTALIAQSTPASPQAPCTNESAYLTPGTWGKQKTDDLAMADNSFPKTQYKGVLAKAQKVVPLLMKANPEFKGLQAFAKRAIRGDSYSPGGALPFRVDAAYDAYICVGSDTYIVEARGKVILNGNAHPVIVFFNSLGYLVEGVIDGEGFRTADGDIVYESPKQIGEFRGFKLFRPVDRRNSNSEAVIIAPEGRSPLRPVTREQFLKTRLKYYQDGSASSSSEIAYLKASLANMTPGELGSQAIVSNVFAVPGKEKIFTTEGTGGGKPLAVVDKTFFDPKLPRDTIQLIVVLWAWDEQHPSRAEMIRQFKQNFDFDSLKQMLGK